MDAAIQYPNSITLPVPLLCLKIYKSNLFYTRKNLKMIKIEKLAESNSNAFFNPTKKKKKRVKH